MDQKYWDEAAEEIARDLLNAGFRPSMVRRIWWLAKYKHLDYSWKSDQEILALWDKRNQK